MCNACVIGTRNYEMTVCGIWPVVGCGKVSSRNGLHRVLWVFLSCRTFPADIIHFWYVMS